MVWFTDTHHSYHGCSSNGRAWEFVRLVRTALPSIPSVTKQREHWTKVSCFRSLIVFDLGGSDLICAGHLLSFFFLLPCFDSFSTMIFRIPILSEAVRCSSVRSIASHAGVGCARVVVDMDETLRITNTNHTHDESNSSIYVSYLARRISNCHSDMMTFVI